MANRQRTGLVNSAFMLGRSGHTNAYLLANVLFADYSELEDKSVSSFASKSFKLLSFLSAPR